MSFFSRIFGRKPKPQGRPPINEDWRVGDLAVCVVRASAWGAEFGIRAGPSHNEVCRVTRVYPGVAYNGFVGWGISLAGYAEPGFDARCFRKPEADSRAADAEFTALIKRPIHKPVEA